MVLIERDERGAAVVACSHEARPDGKRVAVRVKRLVGRGRLWGRDQWEARGPGPQIPKACRALSH